MAYERKQNESNEKNTSENSVARKSSLTNGVSNGVSSSGGRSSLSSRSHPSVVGGITNIFRRNSDIDASFPLAVSNTKKAVMMEGFLKINFGLKTDEPVIPDTWERLLVQNGFSSKRVSLCMAALTGDIAKLRKVGVDEAKEDEGTWSEAVTPLEFEIAGGGVNSPVQFFSVGPLALAAERLDIDTLDFIRQKILVQEWRVAMQVEIVRGTGKTPLGFLKKYLNEECSSLVEKSLGELVTELRVCRIALESEEVNAPDQLEVKADNGSAVKKIRDKILVAIIPHITDLEDRSVEELVQLFCICGKILDIGVSDKFVEVIVAKREQIIKKAMEIAKTRAYGNEGSLSIENLEQYLKELDTLLTAVSNDEVVRLEKARALLLLGDLKNAHPQKKEDQQAADQHFLEAAEIFRSSSENRHKERGVDLYMQVFDRAPAKVDRPTLILCAHTYDQLGLPERAIQVYAKLLKGCPRGDQASQLSILMAQADSWGVLACQQLKLSEEKGDDSAAIRQKAEEALDNAQAAYDGVMMGRKTQLKKQHSPSILYKKAYLFCAFSKFSKALEEYRPYYNYHCLEIPDVTEKNEPANGFRTGFCRLLNEIQLRGTSHELMQQDRTFGGMVVSLMQAARKQHDVNNFGACHVYACVSRVFGDRGIAAGAYEKALWLWDERVSTKEEKGMILLELARTYVQLADHVNALRVYALVEKEKVSLEEIDQANKKSAEIAVVEAARLAALAAEEAEKLKLQKVKAAEVVMSCLPNQSAEGFNRPEEGDDEKKDVESSPAQQQAQAGNSGKSKGSWSFAGSLVGRALGMGKKSGSVPGANSTAEASSGRASVDGAAAAAAGLFATAGGAGEGQVPLPLKMPRPPTQSRPSAGGEQDNGAGAAKPPVKSSKFGFSFGKSGSKGGSPYASAKIPA